MARELTGLILAIWATWSPVLGQQQAGGVDRLFVLERGHGTAPSQGRFAPGYNDGTPFDLADNCYLIHHPKGYHCGEPAFPTGSFRFQAVCRATTGGRNGV